MSLLGTRPGREEDTNERQRLLSDPLRGRQGLDHVSSAFDSFIQIGTATLNDLQNQRAILKVNV